MLHDSNRKSIVFLSLNFCLSSITQSCQSLRHIELLHDRVASAQWVNWSNKELPGLGEHDHSVEDAQPLEHVNEYVPVVLSIEHGAKLRNTTAVCISTPYMASQ
jgi:hypothetical protein